MNIKYIYIVFFSFVAITAKGQTLLTLDKAIDMALENNYGIKMANNNTEIAKNNAKKGEAGLLPSINFNGGSQYAITNTNQLFFNGQNNPENPTKALTYNAGIELNQTLYEGGNRKYRFQLLKTQLGQAQLQNRTAIENTILQVTNAYLLALTEYENKLAREKSLEISKDRLQRAATENEFGINRRLDLLNARVDFNNDSIALMNVSNRYNKQKLQLVELINSEWTNSNFNVDKNIKTFAIFNIDDLIVEAKANNVNLLSNKNFLLQSKQNLQIEKSNTLPKLSLRSGYSYNGQDDPSTNTGQFQTSLNLSFNIFNGGQQKRRINNAKLNIENQEFSLKQQELQVERTLRELWLDYQNQLENLKTETANLQATELNLNFSHELLKNGQITNIQFREAQQNLIQSITNIATAKLNAKLIEYNLLRISGRLVNFIEK